MPFDPSSLNPDQNWGTLVKPDKLSPAYKNIVPVVYGRKWVDSQLVWTALNAIGAYSGQHVPSYRQWWGGIVWRPFEKEATAWVAGTVYAVGDIRTNGEHLYRCTQGGIAGSMPPSGTDSVIVDGAVRWEWLQEGKSLLGMTKGGGPLSPAIYSICEGPIRGVVGAMKDSIYFSADGQIGLVPWPARDGDTVPVIRQASGRADPPLAMMSGLWHDYGTGGGAAEGDCPLAGGDSTPMWDGTSYPKTSNPDANLAGFALGVADQDWPTGWDFYNGTTRLTPAFTFIATERLGMSGTAVYRTLGLVIAKDSSDYPTIQFLVDGLAQHDPANGVYGCNPADVLMDLWTNTRYGLGRSADELDVEHGMDGQTASSYRAYCNELGMFVSRAITSSETLADAMTSLLDETNSRAVWTTDANGNGLLRIVPLGSAAQGAYQPPTSGRATLGPDEFIVSDVNADGIQIERSPYAEVLNYFPVQFETNEGLSGKTTARVTNTHFADLDGKQEASSPYSSKWIASSAHAMVLSYIFADRARNVRRKFRFTLSPRWTLLEGGDLISINHPRLGLTDAPAIILSAEERDDGTIDIVAEDWQGTVVPAPVIQVQDGLSGGGIGLPGEDLPDVLVDLAAIQAQLADLSDDSKITPPEKTAVRSDLMMLLHDVIELNVAAAAAIGGTVSPLSDDIIGALGNYQASIKAIVDYATAVTPTYPASASSSNGLGFPNTTLACALSPSFSYTEPLVADYGTWNAVSDVGRTDGTITIDPVIFRSLFLDAFIDRNELLRMVSGYRIAFAGSGGSSGGGNTVLYGTRAAREAATGLSDGTIWIETDQNYWPWQWSTAYGWRSMTMKDTSLWGRAEGRTVLYAILQVGNLQGRADGVGRLYGSLSDTPLDGGAPAWGTVAAQGWLYATGLMGLADGNSGAMGRSMLNAVEALADASADVELRASWMESLQGLADGLGASYLGEIARQAIKALADGACSIDGATIENIINGFSGGSGGGTLRPPNLVEKNSIGPDQLMLAGTAGGTGGAEAAQAVALAVFGAAESAADALGTTRAAITSLTGVAPGAAWADSGISGGQFAVFDALAANAVVAGVIAAGAVIAGNIAAGAVTAGVVAAEAIVSKNLVLVDFDQQFPNGGNTRSIPAGAIETTGVAVDANTTLQPEYRFLYDTTAAPIRGTEAASSKRGFDGNTLVRRLAPSASQTVEIATDLPCKGGTSAQNPGDWFVIEAMGERRDGNTLGSAMYLRLSMEFYASGGSTPLATVVSNTVSAIPSVYPTWALMSLKAQAPAGAATVRFKVQAYGGTQGAEFWADRIYARRMNNANMIVDGSITANHIAAGTITTTQLAFTPLASDNVIASINASTEGGGTLQINAAKLKIGASTTFESGYNPKTVGDNLTALQNALNNDNVISTVEKASVKPLSDALIAEAAGIVNQATTLGMAANDAAIQAYSYSTTGAVQLLSAFLTANSLWGSMSADTTLSGTGNNTGVYLRTLIQNVITTKQSLMNAIAQRARDNAVATSSQSLTDALSVLNNDDVITPQEKSPLKSVYDGLVAERAGLYGQASASYASAITARNTYDGYVTQLVNFVAGTVGSNGGPVSSGRNPAGDLFATMNANTVLNAGEGAILRTRFQNVQSAKTAYVSELAKQAQSLATAVANGVQNNLDTLSGQINADNIVTPPEKSALKAIYDGLVAEYPTLYNQASSYNVITERDAYYTKITALTNYVSGTPGGALFSSMATSTTLAEANGDTLRLRFQDAITAKATLLTVLGDAYRDAAVARIGTWDGTKTVIDGGNILTGSIAAKQLALADFANLCLNPNLDTADRWSFSGMYWVSTDGRGPKKGCVYTPINGVANTVRNQGLVRVSEGDEFYAECWIYLNQPQNCYVRITGYTDAAGTQGEVQIANGNYAAQGGWQKSSCAGVVPAGVAVIRVEGVSAGGVPVAGANLFDDFSLRRKNNASLIVDGSVSALLLRGDAIQSSNYNGPTGANPGAWTAVPQLGARVENNAPHIRVAASGIRIGNKTMEEHWVNDTLMAVGTFSWLTGGSGIGYNGQNKRMDPSSSFVTTTIQGVGGRTAVRVYHTLNTLIPGCNVIPFIQKWEADVVGLWLQPTYLGTTYIDISVVSGTGAYIPASQYGIKFSLMLVATGATGCTFGA